MYWEPSCYKNFQLDRWYNTEIKQLPLVFLFVILLNACLAPIPAKPLTIEPNSTPAPVHVALPPELRPVAQGLQACADAHPEVALFIDEIPSSSPGLYKFDLSFQLGIQATLPALAAPVAQEDIVVITNPENTLSRIGANDLRAIFSGQGMDWQVFSRPAQTIQVWIYPEGNPVRNLFDNAVLRGVKATSQALIAPDPEAMLEGVSSHPGSIGYLPKAFLTDKVHSLAIDPEIQSALHQPVLATASQEPPSTARLLVTCLQSGAGKESLKEHYQP